MNSFLRKLTWLARRDRKEAELLEELQFHLDEDADERSAEGLPIDEARRAARRDFGNPAIVREDTRSAWTWRLLEQFAQDLRYGARTLAANKTFSALAILSLALGIGANAAIFSFMDAILMRSLPVPDPESLVSLAWHTKRPEFHGTDRHDDNYRDPGGGYVGGIFAYQVFELLQRDTSVFSTVFGYQSAGDLHLAIKGEAQIENTEYVSGNYFNSLGVLPASGRLIGPGDDRAGAAAIAVISYRLSQSRFGGPANAAGQAILLDNIPFTVVGVTPPEFFGADPDAQPAVYLPMHANLLLEPRSKFETPETRYTYPDYDWVVPMARLRPGVTAAQAQAAAGVAFTQWEIATHPDRPKADLPTLIVKTATGGLDSLRRAYSKPLYVLFGLVGLILAIACANIANLLLARASARTREMAVRLSIGADRPRVIRQLLTESLLLAGIGGALGVAFAWWSVGVLNALLAHGRDDQSFGLPITLNWRVLAAMAALSMLTGLLFGLAPAIRGTRVDLTPALKPARGRGSLAQSGDRRLGLGRALVVAQMVFTLLMLVAAGLFLRTLSNLESIHLGFNGEHVLTLEVNARQAGHRDPEIGTFYDRLLSQFSGIPGVRTVTLSRSPLLGVGNSAGGVKIPGRDIKPTRILPIGPDFFATMGIPVLRGRAIEARDRLGAPYVAVVNQQFAKSVFGTEDPIGRHVISLACDTCELEVVGVVGDSLYGNLRATTFFPAGPPPILFLSFSQAIWEPLGDVWYELKTTGDPLSVAAAVRDTVKRADPRVPVIRMKTQRALIDGTINQEITFARLGTAAALLALVIACVGLYGTVSYGVARRTSEIGVRMALGAPRATVMWLVLREVLALAALGLAISVPAALAASKVVESFLFGTKRNDPLTLAAAVLTMTAATMLAGYLPARTASRIDPMVALRYE